MVHEYELLRDALLQQRKACNPLMVQTEIEYLKNKDLLSATDLALLFNVKVRTIYSWCKKNELKAVKMGRRWYYRWNEVIAVATAKKLACAEPIFIIPT